MFILIIEKKGDSTDFMDNYDIEERYHLTNVHYDTFYNSSKSTRFSNQTATNTFDHWLDADQ